MINTLAYSPDITSREYLEDHLKERSKKSEPKDLFMVPPEKTKQYLYIQFQVD